MCFKSDDFDKKIQTCVSQELEMTELETRPLDLPKISENCRTAGLSPKACLSLGVIRVSFDTTCTSTIMKEKVVLSCTCPECTTEEKLEKADRVKALLQRILVCQ